MNKKTLIKPFLAVALAGGFALTSASAQTLLLHYTFDEGSGSALDTGASPAADGTFMQGATRTSNTASVAGAAGQSQWALDISANNSGNAPDFSGSFLDGGDPAKIDGLSAFTLSGWINLQGAPLHGQRIMSKQAPWDGATSPGFSFALNNPSSGTIAADNFALNMALGASGGFSFSTSGTLSADNEWLFVAVTYDGSAVRFYSGGPAEAVTMSGSAGSASGAVLEVPGRNFLVGSTDAAAEPGATSPPAWLDDIRIYGSALSASELDAVRLAIPEPSTYAAIFGGLALLGAFVYRRRLRK